MKTISVVGLSLENDGVGSIVDAIAQEREATATILNNGGSYRSSFVRRGGVMHQFSQFGSATLIPKVKTFIHRHFVVNPVSMLAEADVLNAKGIKDAFDRTFVHAECLVCTPYNTAFARGKKAVGKFTDMDWTGSKSVQELREVLKLKDILYGGKHLRERLNSVRCEAMEQFSKMYEGRDELIDPVLLDTFSGDDEELLKRYEKFRSCAAIMHGDHLTELMNMEPLAIAENFRRPSSIETIGVTRTYRVTRRKGEDGLQPLNLDDDNNKSELENRWLGAPAAMKLNLSALANSAAILNPTSLAVTHCDKLREFSDWKFFDGESEVSVPSKDAVAKIAECVKAQVVIESHGKSASDKVFLQI